MNAMLMTLLLGATTAPAAGLDDAQFDRLHRQLQPPAEEGWSSLPWKTSLVQACVLAARQKKPLLMVVRAGHPLGCV